MEPHVTPPFGLLDALPPVAIAAISAGCAITDLSIALWFFAGAPSPGELRARLARA
jgi:hypothetical protein